MKDRRGHAVVVGLVVAVALVATSCQWTLPKYDLANTNHNPTERTLAVGNISGLHEQWTSAPLGSTTTSPPIVFDGKVFVGTWAGLQAFDANGVQGCSGTPKVCAPLWTAPGFGYQPFVHDGRVVAGGSDAYGTFDPDGVVGCSGSPVVCEPQATVAIDGSLSLLAGGSEVFVLSIDWDTGDPQVQVFDDAVLDTGCSEPCLPARTYAVPCENDGGFCEGLDFAVTASHVIVTYSTWGGWREDGVIMAFDRAGVAGCTGAPLTCAALWTRNTGMSTVAAHDSVIVAPQTIVEDLGISTEVTSEIGVFDEETGAHLWSSATELDGSPFPGEVAIAAGSAHYRPDGATEVRAFPLVPGGCTTDCPPSHVADVQGFSAVGPRLAAGMVFVGSNLGIQAFDAAGVTGCSGSPVVCSPLVIASASGGANIGELVVANGTVVGVGQDLRLHVFGIG